jgi:hypothetical protein
MWPIIRLPLGISVPSASVAGFLVSKVIACPAAAFLVSIFPASSVWTEVM